MTETERVRVNEHTLCAIEGVCVCGVRDREKIKL